MMDRLQGLEIRPLMPLDAEAIAGWRYSGDYAFYNPSLDRESDSAEYLLDPSNRFHSVRRTSELIGFCCFGADARVTGGTYDIEALDIGAGMAPAFVGQGHGRAFLGAVVEHAVTHLGALALRATIASWNDRAQRAARGVGFRSVSKFRSPWGVDFTILVLNRVAPLSRT